MKINQRIITIALVTVAAIAGFVVIPVMASTVSLIGVDSSGLADLFARLNLDGGAGFSGVSSGPIPEPATMFLLGVGLIGLAGVSRRKARL